MKYGDKRDYRKINIYQKSTGKYLFSTTWSKTCREAVEQIIKHYGDGTGNADIKASYK